MVVILQVTPESTANGWFITALSKMTVPVIWLLYCRLLQSQLLMVGSLQVYLE